MTAIINSAPNAISACVRRSTGSCFMFTCGGSGVVGWAGAACTAKSFNVVSSTPRSERSSGVVVGVVIANLPFLDCLIRPTVVGPEVIAVTVGGCQVSRLDSHLADTIGGAWADLGNLGQRRNTKWG